MNMSRNPKSTGRGRGHQLNSTPLPKPNSSDSGRPTNSPSSPSRQHGTQPAGGGVGLKVTVSDSAVGSTMISGSLNVGAVEFVPKSTQSQPCLAQSEILEDTGSYPYQQLIDHLEDKLNELLMNPSQFNLVAADLTSFFSTNLIDEGSMGVACDVIFEWAVSMENFAYSSTRLIIYLSECVTVNHKGTFRQHMLKRCHMEHIEHENLLVTNQTRFQAFTLFLAELYTKLVDTNGNRLSPLSDAVLKLVKTMLSVLNDGFAKTTTQTLKLCGSCLEDDLRASGNKEAMDLLMAELASQQGKTTSQCLCYFTDLMYNLFLCI